MFYRNRQSYVIEGWVYFDGVRLRSSGVDVELSVDGRTFVWKGRRYPKGLFFLVRFADGREALISEDALEMLRR